MSFFEFIKKVIVSNYTNILIGVGNTLLVSLISTLIGLVIGILIGIFRTIPNPKNKFLYTLKKIGDIILSAYVEVFRGTPMMVQAMIIFNGLTLLSSDPHIAHSTTFVTLTAILIVSINTGAYMAEIVRGGIISIDKGQFEGANAIGMTHFQTMFHVVIPQTLRNILPSVANEFVINIKDTSVLSIICFTELFFIIDDIANDNYKVIPVYLLGAAIYFVLTFAITRLLRFIEKKMDGKKDYAIVGSQNMDADSYAREKNLNGGNN